MVPACAVSDHSVLRPISNLRNCYSTIRRNCKNKMLYRLKDEVIFVGGAFSLDMSIYLLQIHNQKLLQSQKMKKKNQIASASYFETYPKPYLLSRKELTDAIHMPAR